MNATNKALSYLLAINFETLFMIMGSWFLWEWLSKKWPIEIGWGVIIFPLASVAILTKWYRFLRFVVKNDSDKR